MSEQLPVVTPEQQKTVVELASAARLAHAEAEASAARFREAQARTELYVFRVMATLGVSPEEYRPVLEAGGLRFEKIAAEGGAN